MVITIREGSDIPIYQQIRDQIVRGISDGRLKAGEQLPTVRGLAEEIGINSMTVNKAYQLLKQQGYIIADRRSGARVSKSFEKTSRLSAESRELLYRIIAEAKVGGMTQEAFLEECRRCFECGGAAEAAGEDGVKEEGREVYV
ncbi:MAG: GntR family transcriptional regulator [Lachnospiraceae bacterium]|nr:GntR family transcriptional regulator [Lachnospiraceae bacterium]